MKEQITIVQSSIEKAKKPTYNLNEIEVLKYEELEPSNRPTFLEVFGRLTVRLGQGIAEVTILGLKSAAERLKCQIERQRRVRYLSNLARSEREDWPQSRPVSKKIKRRLKVTLEIDEEYDLP